MATPLEQHRALDELMARYLSDDANAGRFPSSTTVLDLMKWSATHLAAPPQEQCSGCGEFMSAIRTEMGLTRCSDCMDRPRRRRGGR